ncbi:hypothetical protein [Parasulfitobacter algicola]|uniref:Uncharacterized protein n=1 Tax=Parasulfitobacter algicola TaxID=2614809 RepID=A0ABX2IMI5_9RHOB|nr:hypothetical protein [Sulfitobacter algicola]NSX54089.1 hypothetical protein [Sulfitobacter algicola]
MTEGQPNFVYGQFELITNYPECSAPHQTAYRVPIIANDINYMIYDENSNIKAVVENGIVTLTRPVCYTTVRRGVESTHTPLDCGQKVEERLVEQIEKLDMSISMQGEVTICLSPMEFQLTESTWKVTVDSSEGQRVFSALDKGSIGAQNVPIASLGDEGSAILFKHLQNWYWRDIFENPAVELMLDAMQTDLNMIQATLGCFPINTEFDELDGLFLGSVAYVGIVNDERQTCSGKHCQTINRLNGLRGQLQAAYEKQKICPIEK